MSNLRHIAVLTALLAPLTFAHNAFAVGSDVDFCFSTTDSNGNTVVSDSAGTVISYDCAEGKVHNKALVVVQSVEITQEATSKKNCASTTKKHTANLSNGNGFRLSLDPNCSYAFKFNTSDGCGGDKKGQISRRNINDGETEMVLGGACGSLKAKSQKLSKSEQ